MVGTLLLFNFYLLFSYIFCTEKPIESNIKIESYQIFPNKMILAVSHKNRYLYTNLSEKLQFDINFGCKNNFKFHYIIYDNESNAFLSCRNTKTLYDLFNDWRKKQMNGIIISIKRMITTVLLRIILLIK